MTGRPEHPEEEDRLFNPERYSPVKPDVILRLSGGSTRAFWVASTLGRFLRLDGSSDRLQSARDAAGTLVTAKRRAVILEALGLSQRRWEQLVTDWEQRYIAHRCGRGSVFLFAHALLEECPSCHVELLAEHLPPSPTPERPGFASKRKDSSPPSERTLRIGRRNPSLAPAETVRLSGTDRLHPPNRSLPRAEVGVRGSDPSEPSEAMDSQSRAARSNGVRGAT